MFAHDLTALVVLFADVQDETLRLAHEVWQFPRGLEWRTLAPTVRWNEFAAHLRPWLLWMCADKKLCSLDELETVRLLFENCFGFDPMQRRPDQGAATCACSLLSLGSSIHL